jgi:hypothetical protein
MSMKVQVKEGESGPQSVSDSLDDAAAVGAPAEKEKTLDIVLDHIGTKNKRITVGRNRD